jgi:hypothetical protein
MKYAEPDPVTVQGETGKTRTTIHVPVQPATALNARASHVTLDARFLTVGIASLLLLLLVAVASPGFWSFASLHGGELTKSLAGWGTQGRDQPVSHGQVVAPPPLRPGPNNEDGAQRPAAGSDRAAPLPHALAVAVLPGQQFEVRFSFTNTGTTIWSHADGYALTCASQRHVGATCLGFAPISFGRYVVLPGDRYTFTVLLTAPERTGSFAIWLNVGRGGRLFATQDLLLNVKSQAALAPTPKPGATPPPQSTSTPQPTPPPQPTATPQPTPPPAPTATPQPTATPDPTATPPQPTVSPAPTATPQTEAAATPPDVATPTVLPEGRLIPLSLSQ